jgi:prepilin-type N-terminal cleavage/methylation domain-containing protein
VDYDQRTERAHYEQSLKDISQLEATDMKKNYPTLMGRQGFTLAEIVIATALSTLVAAGAFMAFGFAIRNVLAGGYQVQFNYSARIAGEKIAQYIEDGKTVGISSNGTGLDIITVNMINSRIYYVRGSNPNTVQSNKLMYVPNVANSNVGVKTLCTYVRPLDDGTPMFSILTMCPNAARVCFHVGDGTNMQDRSFSGTGPGYQGVEVRMSATPRNIQRWYQ